MLIVMIVIAILALSVFIWIREEEKEFQERQAKKIRELEIINRAYYKFMDFLLETLSDESVDQTLKYKILKYSHENKIDLNPDGD